MLTTIDSNCAAVFEQHRDAETAIRELQRVGFDMAKLSIVGSHAAEHAIGFYNAGDRVRLCGQLGAFWGDLSDMLFAPAFFWIPGMGPILTGGLIGCVIMGTIERPPVGAAVDGGTTALAAALTKLGIPKDSVVRYEGALKADKFLLIASGTATEVARARAIAAEHGGQVTIHTRGPAARESAIRGRT